MRVDFSVIVGVPCFYAPKKFQARPAIRVSGMNAREGKYPLHPGTGSSAESGAGAIHLDCFAASLLRMTREERSGSRRAGKWHTKPVIARNEAIQPGVLLASACQETGDGGKGQKLPTYQAAGYESGLLRRRDPENDRVGRPVSWLLIPVP
jgi:hypothetical protein